MLEAIFCALRQHFLKRERRKSPLQLKLICLIKQYPHTKQEKKVHNQSLEGLRECYATLAASFHTAGTQMFGARPGVT